MNTVLFSYKVSRLFTAMAKHAQVAHLLADELSISRHKHKHSLVTVTLAEHFPHRGP